MLRTEIQNTLAAVQGSPGSPGSLSTETESPSEAEESTIFSGDPYARPSQLFAGDALHETLKALSQTAPATLPQVPWPSTESISGRMSTLFVVRSARKTLNTSQSRRNVKSGTASPGRRTLKSTDSSRRTLRSLLSPRKLY